MITFWEADDICIYITKSIVEWNIWKKNDIKCWTERFLHKIKSKLRSIKNVYCKFSIKKKHNMCSYK